ncbi:hypothetical protein BT63DRAFT_451625 [Microthyrium microscopicum]|uniref:ATP synthase subunit K, mitochondrial n=1 Tax=Microthyrium microscopicum TaxID=703497 RepID=A0A6A6UMW0_9PEZI|nr:hypothetical protein BT63DRAFT_451625 [Microthyrium microscopicum]
MVTYYTVFGAKVGSHVLSMATLGTTGLVGWYFTRGKKEITNSPPINAGSKEEESFVKDFMKKKESEAKQ